MQPASQRGDLPQECRSLRRGYTRTTRVVDVTTDEQNGLRTCAGDESRRIGKAPCPISAVTCGFVPAVARLDRSRAGRRDLSHCGVRPQRARRSWLRPVGNSTRARTCELCPFCRDMVLKDTPAMQLGPARAGASARPSTSTRRTSVQKVLGRCEVLPRPTRLSRVATTSSTGRSTRQGGVGGSCAACWRGRARPRSRRCARARGPLRLATLLREDAEHRGREAVLGAPEALGKPRHLEGADVEGVQQLADRASRGGRPRMPAVDVVDRRAAGARRTTRCARRAGVGQGVPAWIEPQSWPDEVELLAGGDGRLDHGDQVVGEPLVAVVPDSRSAPRIGLRHGRRT